MDECWFFFLLSFDHCSNHLCVREKQGNSTTTTAFSFWFFYVCRSKSRKCNARYRSVLIMTFSSRFKTLSPFAFTAEDELRLSVKQGLEVHFFKALSKFHGDSLNKIVNEVKCVHGQLSRTVLTIFYLA